MDDVSCRMVALALAALWGGFGLFALARFVLRSPHGRALAGRLHRAGPLSQAATLVLLAAAVAVGGSKPGGGNQQRTAPDARSGNAPAPAAAGEPGFGLVEVRTSGVALRAEPTNAVEAAAWRLRGASEDGFWIERDEPFFALGTNPVRRVHAAASGALSFESARRPPLGAALPDGTALPALAPLRAPLGILPAAAEGTNAAPSRFWHAPAPGGGLLVAWENVALDRLPVRRVTVQAELKPSGDFTYRYDFADALDPPATNLVIGAQAGTNGVNALAILGTNLLSAPVWRVNGGASPPGEPQFVANLLCTNGALRTPARFALEWKNTTGLEPAADTDEDGVSDWDEIFRHDTDPRQHDTDGDGLSDGAEILASADPRNADEDGDGIPDGAHPAVWAANPCWADNSEDGAKFLVTLGTAIPANEAATLVVGSLAIPLRAPHGYALSIPRGVMVPFRLFSTCSGTVDLSIHEVPAAESPPLRSAGATRDDSGNPLWICDPNGVFGGTSRTGSGNLASPVLRLVDENGSEAEDFCIHDGRETSSKTWTISVDPAETGLTVESMFFQGFDLDGANEFSLSIQGPHPASASGTVWIASPDLFLGWAAATRSIHRCLADRLTWCYACDMYHDPDDADACPHEDGCPAKTEAAAACACPIPVIRVNGPGTGPSSIARVRFPVGGLCCCSGDLVAPFVKITHVDDNLQVTNATGTVAVSNVVSGVAGIRATGLSGTEPSTVKYDVIHRHYDDSGAITNEVMTNATLKVWAVDVLHEPVTTDAVGGLSVNPSGVVTGSNALFRIAITPTNFPSSLVSWTAAPANRVSFPSGTNGTEVVVHGDVAGNVTLTAHIEGYAGPPPVCEAKVVPETTIPIHAFIICETGYASTNAAGIHSIVDGVNDIYSQVGRRFNLASVHSITNTSWLDIQRIGGRWSPFSDIVNYTNATGGIEVYFVRSIAGANGLTTHAGVIVKGGVQPNTLAHELGHAQDLPDIYVDARSGVNSVTGLVSRARIPADWGSQSDEGYYTSDLQQSHLVRRLLMFGVGNPDKRDISSGDIQGNWRQPFTSGAYQDTLSPVGFFIHANSHPVSN